MKRVVVCIRSQTICLAKSSGTELQVVLSNKVRLLVLCAHHNVIPKTDYIVAALKSGGKHISVASTSRLIVCDGKVYLDWYSQQTTKLKIICLSCVKYLVTV